MKLSDWQDGVPPSDGIWEIHVPEHDTLTKEAYYYARFKDGRWGVGNKLLDLEWHKLYNFISYLSNNDPANPRKWRGQIEE